MQGIIGSTRPLVSGPIVIEDKMPLIELLSEATKTAFRPMSGLSRGEFLLIDTPEKEEVFHLDYVKLKKISPEEVTNYRGKLIRDDRGGVYAPLHAYADASIEAFFDALPETKKKQHSSIRVSGATDYTVVAINACWPEEHILFASAEARLMYETILLRFASHNKRAEMQARFKISGEVPALPHDFQGLPGNLKLEPYQQTAMMFSLGQESTALFMDRGTGKTCTTIARISLEAMRTRAGFFGRPRMMRVLIVVPNQVRLNWQLELQRFATAPGKVVVLRGNQPQRVKLLTVAMRDEEQYAFAACIIGYDTVPSDVDILGMVDWDLLILDESHYIKSPETQRWKSLRVLKEKAARRHILTGTPVANTINDLFTQLEFLGVGNSGFSSYKAFRYWHGRYERGVADGAGNARETLVGIRNIPLMHERLTRLAFSITKEEAKLNLPPKVYDVVEVEMTPRQRDYYQKMLDTVALEIDELTERGEKSGLSKSVIAQNVLTHLLRLTQITSGFVKWDDQIDPDSDNVLEPEMLKGKIEQIDPVNPKVQALLDLLKEDIAESPNSKTIVWAIFREDIRAIKAALDAAGIKAVLYYGDTAEKDREIAVNLFNSDPETKVFIANAATAGEGLNLIGYDVHNPGASPCYCGREVFYSQNWSLIQRAQAEDRAHRRGTRESVRITDLVIPDTIDQEIRARVVNKRDTAALIQDVTEILKSVLKK